MSISKQENPKHWHKPQTNNLTKSILEIETFADLGLQKKKTPELTLACDGYLKMINLQARLSCTLFDT